MKPYVTSSYHRRPSLLQSGILTPLLAAPIRGHKALMMRTGCTSSHVNKIWSIPQSIHPWRSRIKSVEWSSLISPNTHLGKTACVLELHALYGVKNMNIVTLQSEPGIIQTGGDAWELSTSPLSWCEVVGIEAWSGRATWPANISSVSKHPVRHADVVKTWRASELLPRWDSRPVIHLATHSSTLEFPIRYEGPYGTFSLQANTPCKMRCDPLLELS